MTITNYTVTDTRTMLAPAVYGTPANGYTFTPAAFDAPAVRHSEVIAAHLRGESVTGYVVTVATFGEGTTLDVRGESISRGFDDWDYGLRATYRDDAGEWRRVTVSTDGYDSSAHNTATEDATPEARAAYAAHLAAEQARIDEERCVERAEQRAREERSGEPRGTGRPALATGRVNVTSGSLWQIPHPRSLRYLPDILKPWRDPRRPGSPYSAPSRSPR